MRFSIHVDAPDAQTEDHGSVNIGWCVNPIDHSVIYWPPERVRTESVSQQHSKSAGHCPAVIGLESRYFLIRSPVDIHIRFGRDQDGRPGYQIVEGAKGSIRADRLNSLLLMVSEGEWRRPDAPTLQLRLPYFFICDEPVYLTQTPPFMHFIKEPWPGTLFGGRFPIHVWPRPLMWAFEWYDTSREICIRRGDPLFYVGFETLPQDRHIRLVEASWTDELDEYVRRISGVVSYVDKTFDLFEAAEAVRPDRLLEPVRRGKSDGKRK